MARSVALLVFLPVLVLAQEMMQNPGFESPLAGHWEAVEFNMSTTGDAHSGSSALKATGR